MHLTPIAKRICTILAISFLWCASAQSVSADTAFTPTPLTLSAFTSDMNSIISFFTSSNFVVQIKNSLCDNQYLSASSSASESLNFQSDFAELLCGSTDQSFVPPAASTVSTAPSAQTTSVASTQSAAVSTSTDTVTPSDQENDPITEADILYWTNSERSSNGGLPALSENSILDAIAVARVSDMFTNQYFAHVSPTGQSVSTLAAQDGYQYITIGENIAMGDFTSASDLLTAWMNSPDHRANILNTGYTEIGIAASQGTYEGQTVWIASQVFGRPLSDCPQASSTLKSEVTQMNASADTLQTSLASLQTQMDTVESTDPTLYNQDVVSYNAQAQSFDTMIATIKSLTTEYNEEVQTFNACIQS